MSLNQLHERCQLCLFKHIVCQYLGEKEFEQLYSNTLQLQYKKGENILKQGNKSTQIAYISTGSVKIHYANENHKDLIMTVVKGPGMLGGANVFNEELNMFSVTALEDCQICLIDLNVLKGFALTNSAFALRLLDFVSSMFKDSIFNFISLANKQVNGRIADILIYLSKKVYKRNPFVLTLTRKEIAEFAACSQENVIHTLSRFEKEGLIKNDKKLLTILDMERLILVSKNG